MSEGIVRLLRVPAIIVGIYLVGEIAVRGHLFGPAAIRHPTQYRATSFLNGPMWAPHPDPGIKITLRPNVRLRFKGHFFTTNEYSLRGPAVKLEKTPGVTRIALIGACFAAGELVDDGEEYPRVLEGLLNATGPERYEVLNFSSPGRTLQMVVRLYNHDIRRFHPDLVLVEYPGTAREFKTTGEIPLYEWRPPPRTTVQSILGSTFLYASLRKEVGKWGTRHLFPAWQERMLAGVAGGASSARGPGDLVARPPAPLPPWIVSGVTSGRPAAPQPDVSVSSRSAAPRRSALDQFLEQRRAEGIPVVLLRFVGEPPADQTRWTGDGVYVLDLGQKADFGVRDWQHHRSFAERVHAALKPLLDRGQLAPTAPAPRAAGHGAAAPPPSHR
jgi:hypothetical protein